MTNQKGPVPQVTVNFIQIGEQPMPVVVTPSKSPPTPSPISDFYVLQSGGFAEVYISA